MPVLAVSVIARRIGLALDGLRRFYDQRCGCTAWSPDGEVLVPHVNGVDLWRLVGNRTRYSSRTNPEHRISSRLIRPSSASRYACCSMTKLPSGRVARKR